MKDSNKEDLKETILEKLVNKHGILPQGIALERISCLLNRKLNLGDYNKRERKLWTDVELFWLKKGVDQFGVGKWKKILETFKLHFHPVRRATDLKDKYKNFMNRASAVNKIPREYVHINENGDLLDDYIYLSTYPSNAARNLAKRRKLDDEIFFIAEKSTFCEKSKIYKKSFKYLSSIDENKMSVRRIIQKKLKKI